MSYEKKVIQGKVDKNNKKEFKANKHHAGEKDIYILFDNEDDLVIEKLSIEGLPLNTPDGKNITWHNNFVVKDASGKERKNITYRVLLQAADGNTIVTYDDTGLHVYAGSVSSKTFKNKKWKEIQLTKGDPAIGIAI